MQQLRGRARRGGAEDDWRNALQAQPLGDELGTSWKVDNKFHLVTTKR